MMKLLPKLVFCSLFIALLASFVMRICVFSKLATKGDEIKAYEIQIASLSKENNLLKQKIADLSSLSRIKAEALALGMVIPTKLDFLTPPVSASINTNSTEKL